MLALNRNTSAGMPIWLNLLHQVSAKRLDFTVPGELLRLIESFATQKNKYVEISVPEEPIQLTFLCRESQ